VACIVRVLYILGSVKLQSIYVPRELVCELKQARRVLDSSHSRRLNQSFGRTIRANTFMKVVWGGNRDLAHHTLSSRLSAGRPLESIGVVYCKEIGRREQYASARFLCWKREQPMESLCSTQRHDLGLGNWRPLARSSQATLLSWYGRRQSNKNSCHG
jgi:hypothetical protein